MSELSVKFEAGLSRLDQTDRLAPRDGALMCQIAKGDEAAFTELIETHGQWLARLIGRMMAWHADHDDVFQEALLTVWNKAGKFDGTGSLEGWLRKIAVNRVRNHFRAANRLRHLLERLAERLGGFHESTNRTSGTDRDYDDLAGALQQLSTDDRLAVVLFYLEELPGKEVANMLGIRTETLHVKLHRVRKRLKKLLESPPRK